MRIASRSGMAPIVSRSLLAATSPLIVLFIGVGGAKTPTFATASASAATATTLAGAAGQVADRLACNIATQVVRPGNVRLTTCYRDVSLDGAVSIISGAGRAHPLESADVLIRRLQT
jgi:hypothetical protein